jgi:hypothetical protein
MVDLFERIHRREANQRLVLDDENGSFLRCHEDLLADTGGSIRTSRITGISIGYSHGRPYMKGMRFRQVVPPCPLVDLEPVRSAIYSSDDDDCTPQANNSCRMAVRTVLSEHTKT